MYTDGHGMGVPLSMQIAIIDDNVLTGIGLQHLLEDIIPVAEITVLQNFNEVDEVQLNNFVHFFVASRIYFEHSVFFRSNSKKTIVLVSGPMLITGVRTLNVCQSEKTLVRDILTLRSAGHGNVKVHSEDSLLSPREMEVAVLLCKGYINKEVAEKLNISMTTVISHRKNIMQKLNARSLADIIIYVVMNGLVEIGEL